MMRPEPLQGDDGRGVDDAARIEHRKGLFHIDHQYADVFAFRLEAVGAAGVSGVDAAQEDEHGFRHRAGRHQIVEQAEFRGHLT